MANTQIYIKQLPVGQMKANCYLVWDEASKEVLIIDPGDDADYIIKTLQDNDLTPRLIIATHGHFDHIMSVLELKLAFHIPFYMHERDQFLLERMEESALHYIGFDPGPEPEVDDFVKNKTIINIGNTEYKVIHIPGHTPGSIGLYCKEANAVFVGDLVFADGNVGRTDFRYSNVLELSKSIRTISKLPKGTMIYSGHGDPFSVAGLSGSS